MKDNKNVGTVGYPGLLRVVALPTDKCDNYRGKYQSRAQCIRFHRRQSSFADQTTTSTQTTKSHVQVPSEAPRSDKNQLNVTIDYRKALAYIHQLERFISEKVNLTSNTPYTFERKIKVTLTPSAMIILALACLFMTIFSVLTLINRWLPDQLCILRNFCEQEQQEQQLDQISPPLTPTTSSAVYHVQQVEDENETPENSPSTLESIHRRIIGETDHGQPAILMYAGPKTSSVMSKLHSSRAKRSIQRNIRDKSSPFHIEPRQLDFDAENEIDDICPGVIKSTPAKEYNQSLTSSDNPSPIIRPAKKLNQSAQAQQLLKVEATIDPIPEIEETIFTTRSSHLKLMLSKTLRSRSSHKLKQCQCQKCLTSV